MKRIATLLSLLCVLALTLLISGGKAQQVAVRAHATPAASGKVAIPCPIQLDDITDCPETGCGPSLDPHLNTQKNIRSLDGEAEPMTIQEIKDLPDPVSKFKIGDTREKLQALGEGKKIVVVANALAVRKGGGESCNCKLTTVADADNHIVLVDKVLRSRKNESLKDLLSRREEDSVTAEFAPRPRLDLPHLTRANLQPLITANGVQKVRVTGILMFDSEHSLGHHLKRHNNWEIHPVLEMEYCPKRRKCTDDSDDNWVKLGDEP
jgi:hypothetical protein